VRPLYAAERGGGREILDSDCRIGAYARDSKNEPKVGKTEGSVVEMGGGEERAAAERCAEGIEDDNGKYRKSSKTVAGVPGGSVEGYRKLLLQAVAISGRVPLPSRAHGE
jgi:hypothetical protein